MTRSIRGPRRAGLLLAIAAAGTTLLMSGCGAGQIAETAAVRPSVPGINAQSADNAFKIRNLTVDYLNTRGYPDAGTAPLNVVLYNDSAAAVTVKVSTNGARAVVLAGAAAPSASPSGASPSGTASGSASPSASEPATPSPTETPQPPAGGTAEIKLPAGGFVVLNKEAGSWLQLVGLNEPLAPGESVGVRFDFGGTSIDTSAPMSPPEHPAPVASPVTGEEEGGHGG